MKNELSNKDLATKLNIAREEGIHLVLGGGGVKGVAHIALLEFLESKNIRIHKMSGSSAGALVGALYASGVSTELMLDFFKTTPLFKYSWLNPFKGGLFDSYKYEKYLNDYLPELFEGLEIPLIVTAVNLQSGKPRYFNYGKLLPAVLASCAVPAIFSPIEIDGFLYTDGGVMDNFPIEPFLKDSKMLVGSYVSKPPMESKQSLDSIVKVSQHANALLLHSANEHKFDLVDLMIDFPLSDFGTFDLKSIDDIYQKAKQYLESKCQIDGDSNIIAA